MEKSERIIDTYEANDIAGFRQHQRRYNALELARLMYCASTEEEFFHRAVPLALFDPVMDDLASDVNPDSVTTSRDELHGKTMDYIYIGTSRSPSASVDAEANEVLQHLQVYHACCVAGGCLLEIPRQSVYGMTIIKFTDIEAGSTRSVSPAWSSSPSSSPAEQAKFEKASTSPSLTDDDLQPVGHVGHRLHPLRPPSAVNYTINRGAAGEESIIVDMTDCWHLIKFDWNLRTATLAMAADGFHFDIRIPPRRHGSFFMRQGLSMPFAWPFAYDGAAPVSHKRTLSIDSGSSFQAAETDGQHWVPFNSEHPRESFWRVHQLSHEHIVHHVRRRACDGHIYFDRSVAQKGLPLSLQLTSNVSYASPSFFKEYLAIVAPIRFYGRDQSGHVLYSASFMARSTLRPIKGRWFPRPDRQSAVLWFNMRHIFEIWFDVALFVAPQRHTPLSETTVPVFASGYGGDCLPQGWRVAVWPGIVHGDFQSECSRRLADSPEKTIAWLSSIFGAQLDTKVGDTIQLPIYVPPTLALSPLGER